MDADAVRERATTLCDALVAGDVERATEDFSQELRRNLGEVLAMLPLPASEATVESIEHGGSGYNVVLRLVGETDEVQIQTRWKDRQGRPTVVEASHLSQMARSAAEGSAPAEGAGEGAGEAAS
ncbi:MAG TPA: hypothetical protein VFO73_05755 [Candidatus Limnocylindrales bacterium]|nr:hypothetical protein [Candidatus Limnocylindrales bacterium]